MESKYYPPPRFQHAHNNVRLALRYIKEHSYGIARYFYRYCSVLKEEPKREDRVVISDIESYILEQEYTICTCREAVKKPKTGYIWFYYDFTDESIVIPSPAWNIDRKVVRSVIIYAVVYQTGYRYYFGVPDKTTLDMWASRLLNAWCRTHPEDVYTVQKLDKVIAHYVYNAKGIEILDLESIWYWRSDMTCRCRTYTFRFI